MRTSPHLILATFAGLALASSPVAQAATTIFSHTFDGGTGGLNGTVVDGGTGSPQNWVAFSGVNANGVFNSASGSGSDSGGSATLDFSPSNGFQYTLDARILNVTGDANWVGFGFANGQSTASGPNDRFSGSTGGPGTGVVGTAWMLFRGNNTPNANASQNGTGTLGGSGTTDPLNWSTLNNNGGTIDLRILLDTTGGTGNWTATWFAKNSTDLTYTTVRSTAAVLQSSEANYNSVGFAFSTNATDGTLASFSLTQVPEPSAALLGGMGLLALLRRRR